MLSTYWSLSQHGQLQPHSKSKAWQLSTQLQNGLLSAKSWHPFLPWLNIKIYFCSHDTCIFVTVKGKTDTNGYPFEQVNRSLSVRHPVERLKKSVQSVRKTVRTVCISVRNTLASVRSIATSVPTVLTSVRQLKVSVRRTAASV